MLALPLAFSLVACGDGEDTDTQTAEDSKDSVVEPDVPASLTIGGADISEFKIIYAENPMKATYDKYSELVTQDTEYDKQSAERLAELIADTYGAELEVLKDTDTPKGEREINVGNTNRGLKATVNGSLVSDKDYIIKEANGSLAICGKTYGATWHAVEGFMAYCAESDTPAVSVASGFVKSGKADMLVVGCIGDSLTNGSSSEQGDAQGNIPRSDSQLRREIVSYPAVLGRIMWKTMSVYNYGLGGRTMTENFVWADGSGDHAWNVCQYYQPCMDNAANIDLALVMLGTNDASSYRMEQAGYRFGSAYKEKFIESCGNIVNDLKAKNADVTVLLLNCPYAYNEFESNMSRYIRKYQQSAAEQLGLDLVDVYSVTKTMDNSYYPDSLHPSDKGYTMLAEGINKLIAPTVEKLLSDN